MPLSMYSTSQLSEAEQLVETHGPLVQKIAYHLMSRLPASVVVDDLIQVGMLGLLDAAQHYDPSQGATYETYATIRIRGAMLDELRRNDWAPKSVHRRARDLMECVHRIEADTGREARPGEVAGMMGITLNEYHQILQETNSCRILSFVDIGVDDGQLGDNYKAGQTTPLDGLEETRFQEHLVEAIEALPEREKLVIGLYYDEEFNLREIGEVLGVSESRVSQLMSQAHLRMRKQLSDYTARD